MATASLLLPSTCEAYLYDYSTIVGEITAPSGEFKWYTDTVYTDRIPNWLSVVITADSADDANRLARYQADRIMSGLYPCYVKEA